MSKLTILILAILFTMLNGIILYIFVPPFKWKPFIIGSCLGLLPILIPFFLFGCASQTTKVVKVPVTTKPPKIAIPKKPYLPIDSLTKVSSPDVVIKSYAASIKIMQGYSDQLNKILEAYQ